MLPWFTKWNAENPTNIYIPAVAMGTVGGAILVATMAVMWAIPSPMTACRPARAARGCR